MLEERGSEDCLPPGTTLLQGQFKVEQFLNSGGFGITYLARDSLDRRVVIKECFPTTMCWRNEGGVRARTRTHQAEFDSVVRHFGQEARRLAKLSHPNIVGVHQVFEDLGTSYLALDYVEGRDLLHLIENEPTRLAPATIVDMTLKILDAIEHVHAQGILHRDISPDNILLDQNNEPILIDFGAARDTARNASRVLSAISVVKDGYSPQEFYLAGTEQTPASDLYALGATLHHLLTGEAPPYSQLRLAALAERRTDPYQSLVGRIPGFEPGFLQAIDQSLRIFLKDRVQSAEQWRSFLQDAPASARAAARIPDDATITSAIHQLVQETNVVVRAEVEKARQAAEEEALLQLRAQQEAEARRRRILAEARREAEEAALAEGVLEPPTLTFRADEPEIEPAPRRSWLARLFGRSKPPAKVAVVEGMKS